MLDIFVHWEENSLTSPLFETYFSSIGPIPVIVINATMALQGMQSNVKYGIYTSYPFNTAVYGRKRQWSLHASAGIAEAVAAASRNPGCSKATPRRVTDYDVHQKRNRGPIERLHPQADAEDLPHLPKNQRAQKSSKSNELSTSRPHSVAHVKQRIENEMKREHAPEKKSMPLREQ